MRRVRVRDSNFIRDSNEKKKAEPTFSNLGLAYLFSFRLPSLLFFFRLLLILTFSGHRLPL